MTTSAILFLDHDALIELDNLKYAFTLQNNNKQTVICRRAKSRLFNMPADEQSKPLQKAKTLTFCSLSDDKNNILLENKILTI